MFLPKTKQRATRFWSFVILISVLFSLTALVATTSSHSAPSQGKPTVGAARFEIAQRRESKWPEIRVTAKKDKQIYDTVEILEGGLQYSIWVRGQCGGEGAQVHLSYANVDLYSGTKHAGSESFPVNSSHRSIGSNHGEGWATYEVVYPYVHPRTPPTEVCNDDLKRREAAGDSRAALLQRGFMVIFGHAYDAKLSLGCAYNKRPLRFTDPPFEVTTRGKLGAIIRCLPTAYVPTTGAPGRPGVHLDPLITDVELKPEPAEMKGHACPVYVGFRGQITAGKNRPGDDVVKIRYRFVGDRGFTTPFYEANMRKGETKPVYWKRKIEALPIVGGLNKEVAPGVKPKLPIYQGWTTLNVVYPGEGFHGKASEKATFTVDCNPPPQRTAAPSSPKQ